MRLLYRQARWGAAGLREGAVILLDRRPDGTIVFSGTWREFISDWRAATPDNRVILDDGRPAVRRPAADPVTFFTIYPQIWPEIRHKLKEMLALAPPKKRERLCELCRNPMTVSREYEGAWCFVCDVCKSTEIHGKSIIGGTVGQGEREKT